MYGHVHKQSSFSRSISNDQKLGAYYTDIGMCKRIHSLFSFPKEEECCVLEPSIGDGSAVLAVTGKADGGRDNIRIFGVELNPATYEGIKEHPMIDFPLYADFLNGVKISHNSFSFCFANPPYGTDQSNGKRLEYQFVEKMWNYLNSRAILALVIPYYVLTDESFLRGFFKYYQPFAVYRFDDAVYKQFQQIVVIASKRTDGGYLKQVYLDFLLSVSKLEELPYLPETPPEKKIKIMPSRAGDVEYFTSLTFNVEEARTHLSSSPLFDVFASKMFIPSFTATELGHPPMPLKKDLLYLTAIAGGGQGLVGSEENHDLHLQRGVAKVVTTTDVREVKGKPVLVETSFTKIGLHVIENNGRITALD